MRYMLRSIAVGIGVSYESLTKDYSQSNFSSSRLSLIDDRDHWRLLQNFMIDNFLQPLFREWLDAAVLVGALPIEPENYFVHTDDYLKMNWNPRGWGWIDPVKEIAAYKDAVQAGFATTSDVLAEMGNGKDIEDVFHGRRSELNLAQDLNLSFSTEYSDKMPASFDDSSFLNPKESMPQEQQQNQPSAKEKV